MKILNLPTDAIEKIKGEIAYRLSKPLLDGVFEYKKKFELHKEQQKKKATVYMTPEAYVKQMSLILKYDTEVAWRGVVNRVDDYTFIIEDILLYPQTVGASTVGVDDKKYNEWIMDLCSRDDGVYEKLRFQGHSHVNMSTNPSTTDFEHQEDVIDDLPEGSFNIFLIANKTNSFWIRLYDKKTNLVYDKEDINFSVLMESGETIDDFLEEAEDMVLTKKYTYSHKQEEKNQKGAEEVKPMIQTRAKIHVDDEDTMSNDRWGFEDDDYLPEDDYLRGMRYEYWRY